MTLYTVFAYLFLVMAYGIQSGFRKVFDSERSPLYNMAPSYYYNWMRGIPMFCGVILSFYPFYLISPFQLHWGVLIVIHLILVVLIGAILQVVYINTIGYSENSGKHVFRFVLIGSLMIVIVLIVSQVFSYGEQVKELKSKEDKVEKRKDARDNNDLEMYYQEREIYYRNKELTHNRNLTNIEDAKSQNESSKTSKQSALDRIKNTDFSAISKKYDSGYLGGTNTSFDADDND